MSNKLINLLNNKEITGWKNKSGSPLVKMTNMINGKYIEFKREPIPDDMFCITTLTERTSIQLQKNYSPAYVPELVYCTDGSNWKIYNIGDYILLENIGDKVYFRARNWNETFCEDWLDYYNFYIKEYGKQVSISGNIQYLLDKTGNRMDVPNGCFARLFSSMSELLTAPELPATILGEGCYRLMFQSCSKLEKAPELPATNLVKECYRGMFQGCSKLNYVKTHQKEWGADDATYSWLTSVSSSGDFYCNPELEDVRGTSNIPNNWTRHEI